MNIYHLQVTWSEHNSTQDPDVDKHYYYRNMKDAKKKLASIKREFGKDAITFSHIWKIEMNSKPTKSDIVSMLNSRFHEMNY